MLSSLNQSLHASPIKAGFVVLALLVFLSGQAAAQAQADERNSDTGKTGAITGQVVNQSGEPLPKAVVIVRGFGVGGVPARTTVVDREGKFEASGLAARAYLVSATVPGYVAAPRDPDLNPTAYYQIGDSVRLEMLKGGVITGTVTRSNDEPVVVVPVRAYMIRDYKGQPARYGAPFREVNTDDRGVYRIYGLLPGTYVVAAGGGYSSPFNINAYDLDVPTYAPSSTRDTATEVNVRAGDETAGIDIRYRGEPGHTVSGSVISSLSTTEPIRFEVTLTSGFSGGSQESYRAIQQPGGRGFAINGVGDGDYYIVAQTYLPSREWIISEPRRIRVKGGDIGGLELIATPLGSISGHLLLEESQAPECKDKRRPLFGETIVSPWHNEKDDKGKPQFVWGLGGPVLPDQRGDFIFRNLYPGQYRFNTRPMVKYWYLKSISWPGATSSKAATTGRPADAARYWTAVKAGDRLAGLTITLAAGAASLRGQIETAEGQRLPSRLFVYLVPAEREMIEDILRYYVVPSATDGSFNFTNLAPGHYRLIVETVGENEANLLSKLRLPGESELRARLQHVGEAGKTEAELKPCQNITDYRVPFKSPGQ
jgi:protocatechuate 3,4-dioxygenase beta subunit